MRVDILGQVLVEGIKAVQGKRACWSSARLVRSPSPPWIVIEPDLGRLWVHLESGHLTVILSIDIHDQRKRWRDPPLVPAHGEHPG